METYNITVNNVTLERAQEILDTLANEVTGVKQPTEFHEAAGVAPELPDHFVTDGLGDDASTEVNVEVDSSGLPWDERIHSGNRKQTTKGVWQRRRGLQDAQFDEVVAELRNTSVEPVGVIPMAPTPAMVQVIPDTTTIATPIPATPGAAVASITPAPVPIVASVAPPVPAPAPIARDFNGLMTKVGDLFAAGEIEQDYAVLIVQRINDGFSSNIITLPDIANDPKMVDYAWQCIDVDTKAGIIGKAA